MALDLDRNTTRLSASTIRPVDAEVVKVRIGEDTPPARGGGGVSLRRADGTSVVGRLRLGGGIGSVKLESVCSGVFPPGWRRRCESHREADLVAVWGDVGGPGAAEAVQEPKSVAAPVGSGADDGLRGWREPGAEVANAAAHMFELDVEVYDEAAARAWGGVSDRVADDFGDQQQKVVAGAFGQPG